MTRDNAQFIGFIFFEIFKRRFMANTVILISKCTFVKNNYLSLG